MSLWSLLIYTEKVETYFFLSFIFANTTYTTHNFVSEIFVSNLKTLTAKSRSSPALNGQNPSGGTIISLRWSLNGALRNRILVLVTLQNLISTTIKPKHVHISFLLKFGFNITATVIINFILILSGYATR